MTEFSGSDRRRPSGPGEPWLEIVVPARNEESRLPAGLARLCAKAAELPGSVAIIVVDSASTDDTAGIVSRWPAGQVPVRLIRCTRPGKGVAVRAGLLASTAPYVGFCDADMAADLSAVDDAMELLLDGQPLVLGSRAHPASVVEDRHSMFRRAGATVFRAAARRMAAISMNAASECRRTEKVEPGTSCQRTGISIGSAPSWRHRAISSISKAKPGARRL